MATCAGTTKEGKPCRRRALAGSDFCAVHRCDELDERELVGRVAGSEDWRAAAWLLERRYAERWARKPVQQPEPPPPDLDSLDELAGRRAERRSRP